jgi:hypothetical protein
VEHSNTAFYFCEGMHNNRQFALKFYASNADFMADMMAYKELGGGRMLLLLLLLHRECSTLPYCSCIRCMQVLESSNHATCVLPPTLAELVRLVASLKPCNFYCLATDSATVALGPSSTCVPVLEMSYPGSSTYPTSVLVFERGQCTLETFPRRRPSYFQQVTLTDHNHMLNDQSMFV